MLLTSYPVPLSDSYNKRVVYNQKRHETFPLGSRMVTFERRYNVPKQLSPEFWLVDLVNELDGSGYFPREGS